MSEYQLAERIGAGGMGDVYRASEIMPNGKRLPVACKILNGILRRERELIEAFHKEAEINREISHNHPGLVTLHHWVSTRPNGQDYLIMELVDGCSLRDWLEHTQQARSTAERIPLDTVRLIARDVLDTLAYVHRRGITHRDISPGNILISRQGAVKLADLGLAKPPATGKSGSRFDGKPPYASPEALPGQRYDERSDLYSFGAVLYEMLTGAPPFGARVSVGELLARKWPEGWQAPSLPADIPEDLRAVTMGLLHGERDKRHPATAGEARAAICAPEDPDATREALAQVADELYKLGQKRRQGGEPGSHAGVRLMSVQVSAERADGSVRVGEAKRAITAGRMARILGLGLLAVTAVGGLALGLYRQQPAPAPTPSAIVAPSAPPNMPADITPRAEEAAPAEAAETAPAETGPVEPSSPAEREDKRQIAPMPAERAIAEAPAPTANRKRDRARPARTPRRTSRKRTSKAEEAAPAAMTRVSVPRRRGQRPTTDRTEPEHRAVGEALTQTATGQPGSCRVADRQWAPGFARVDC